MQIGFLLCILGESKKTKVLRLPGAERKLDTRGTYDSASPSLKPICLLLYPLGTVKSIYFLGNLTGHTLVSIVAGIGCFPKAQDSTA